MICTDRENVLLLTGRGGLFEDTDQHPPGHTTYPFQFQLPPNLPSSFEDAHGNVRYCVEVKVDRPWKFDYKAKRPFTVNAVYDLNLEPRARVRVPLAPQRCCCFHVLLISSSVYDELL